MEPVRLTKLHRAKHPDLPGKAPVGLAVDAQDRLHHGTAGARIGVLRCCDGRGETSLAEVILEHASPPDVQGHAVESTTQGTAVPPAAWNRGKAGLLETLDELHLDVLHDDLLLIQREHVHADVLRRQQRYDLIAG